jgi:hypothetical protein
MYDNVKMGLTEIGWEGVGVSWIYVPWDEDKWRAVVNTGMNL